MGLTGVLGGILSLALLQNPAPAFSATLPGNSVALAWDNSSSPEVTGHRVYYGVASGNYTNSVVVGNVMTATVSGLVSGVTYFFASAAIGTAGMESNFSNELSLVPGLPAIPTVLIHMAANQQAVLTVKGQSGHTYDIQASQTFTGWNVIGTVTLGASGSVDFTDTNAASFPQHFYRTHDTQP